MNGLKQFVNARKSLFPLDDALGGADHSGSDEPAARLPQSPPAPDEFDWSTDDSVVINEQPPVALYRNSHDQLVIRQRNTLSDDGDQYVVIDPAHLAHFIDMLEIEKAKS
jgi:hypothetical protein